MGLQRIEGGLQLQRLTLLPHVLQKGVAQRTALRQLLLTKGFMQQTQHRQLQSHDAGRVGIT